MTGRRHRLEFMGGLLGLTLCALAPAGLAAQTCTSQAKLTADKRAGLADAASVFAAEVKADSVATLKSAAIAEDASNFAAAGALISDTAGKLNGDNLTVVQVYQLDASSRKAGDTSDADFSCPLAGTANETDFSISGLPPGLYGFAMVEANGPRPWLLSFLLRQESGVWKLAGFYPHPRAAAGHDGLWFWTSARDDAKAKQLWFAWLLYGEADTLLRPANFVSSTNLDKLRSEQRGAAPPELANGIGPDTPLVIRSGPASASGAGPAPGTKDFRFIGVASEGSADGKRLNLVLRLQPSDNTDAASSADYNHAAARSFLDAHKELRQGFDGVIVIAEKTGSEPFVTEQSVSDVP